MTHVSTATVLEALNWRYATQKFDPSRKIAPEIWAALEQSLVLTPSSFGLQPWRFIVVRDPATLARLSEAAWGQPQPLDASHFVVFAVRRNYDRADLDHFIERTAEVQGVPTGSLERYRASIERAVEGMRAGGRLDDWASRQVYIALGQFMAAAALLGIDTCPMEGLQAPRYDEILGLGALGYGTVCAAAAGFRSPSDNASRVPKVRFRAEEVILHA